METPPDTGSSVTGALARVVQRLLVIGGNRLELLLVEMQAERERLLRAIWLSLGAAVFGLLAGIALTVLIVVVLWEHSPVIALAVLSAIYAAAAALCYGRLTRLQREWETLPGTLDQLRKDREWLEKKIN